MKDPLSEKIDEILQIFFTNIEHDGSYVPVTAIKGKVPNAKQALLQLLQDAQREARIDEARYWDEHILGSPRKVTVNEKAKDRIKTLQQERGDK